MEIFNYSIYSSNITDDSFKIYIEARLQGEVFLFASKSKVQDLTDDEKTALTGLVGSYEQINDGCHKKMSSQDSCIANDPKITTQWKLNENDEKPLE